MNPDGEYSYQFTEFPTGFEVTGRERHPVKVELHDYCFTTTNSNNQTFGLYQYYDLSRQIAEGLMSEWKSPKHINDKNGYEPSWVRPWAITQTAKAIGKRVHAQWKRLLGMVDPTVLDVQRAVFAATRGASDVLMDKQLYRDAWLVRDIVRYRAAAIATRFAKEMATNAPHNRAASLIPRIYESSQAAALQELARALGISVDIRVRPLEQDDDISRDMDCVSILQNWRGLFSPTGKEYHSLNRTLMNLPGGVPSSMIAANLSRTELPRPITSRIELNFVLAFINANRQESNIPLVIYSTQDQVIEGIKRVNRYTHNNLNPRRAHDISIFAGFLNDYPEKHTGNLIGLTDKAILWHRTEQDAQIAENIKRLGADTPAARPPIELPVKPEITFLDTVKAICEEGLTMEHCVASYSEQAVHGHCYLFHIKHADESATVEVNRQGKVLQAFGPRDKLNKAAAWGKRALNRWGRDFPESVNYPEEARINPWVDEDVLF